jgi:hypothetical protein
MGISVENEVFGKVDEDAGHGVCARVVSVSRDYRSLSAGSDRLRLFGAGRMVRLS